LFFLGYFLFEIPSNLIMQRVGARLWIARIMITWGLISMGTAFVVGPKSFALARFLLGVGEAGFTPGIYLYFTAWFPGPWRAKATAAFLLGIPIANIVGSPISGALLELGGIAGFKSWQWLLILEGIPAVLLGIACLFVLADRPSKAKWLASDEETWLSRQLTVEQKEMEARHGSSLRAAFTNWRVFALCLINFCGNCRVYRRRTLATADHQGIRSGFFDHWTDRGGTLCLRRGQYVCVGTPRGAKQQSDPVCGWRSDACGGFIGGEHDLFFADT
jgi:MFS family permease